MVLVCVLGGLGGAAARTPDLPADPPQSESGAGATAVPTAATSFGWGAPTWADEFDNVRVPPVWSLYDSPGHDGNGLRRPSQVTVKGGVLTQQGTADAVSAGMVRSAGEARFGRWEVRFRADQRSTGARPYHAVVALIPTTVPYADGERDIDFMEADLGTGEINLFVHYPPRRQDFLTIPLDLAQWHTFAVEIAPTHVAWFVDGVPRATVTRSAAIPTTPLALNVQLDAYRPDDLIPGRLQLDWARFWVLPPTPPRPPAATTPEQGDYDPG